MFFPPLRYCVVAVRIRKKSHISIRNQVNPVRNLAEATWTICLVKDAKCRVLSGAKSVCNIKAVFDGGCYLWGCVL